MNQQLFFEKYSASSFARIRQNRRRNAVPPQRYKKDLKSPRKLMIIFQKKISHQLKKPNARMPPYKPIST
jgi:hypothetical protein